MFCSTFNTWLSMFLGWFSMFSSFVEKDEYMSTTYTYKNHTKTTINLPLYHIFVVFFSVCPHHFAVMMSFVQGMLAFCQTCCALSKVYILNETESNNKHLTYLQFLHKIRKYTSLSDLIFFSGFVTLNV